MFTIRTFSGNQLRVDIQADHSVVKHKGFMASVRMEPRSVLPGMRRMFYNQFVC